MKKAIVLALASMLAMLLLVGCAATEESAPVGASVRLLDPDGIHIGMREAPNPSTAVYLQLPVDLECEVVSGPKTTADVTFWKLDCPDVDGIRLVGWVDVTQFEVLD